LHGPENQDYKVYLSLLLADKKDVFLASCKKGANWKNLEKPCYTCDISGEKLDSFEQWYFFLKKMS
jgi:hypothetical protein